MSQKFSNLLKVVMQYSNFEVKPQNIKNLILIEISNQCITYSSILPQKPGIYCLKQNQSSLKSCIFKTFVFYIDEL